MQHGVIVASRAPARLAFSGYASHRLSQAVPTARYSLAVGELQLHSCALRCITIHQVLNILIHQTHF